MHNGMNVNRFILRHLRVFLAFVGVGVVGCVAVGVSVGVLVGVAVCADVTISVEVAIACGFVVWVVVCGALGTASTSTISSNKLGSVV